MTLRHDTAGDIGDVYYPIPDGRSTDRFLLLIGAAYAVMQSWGESPPQKGDLNGDNQITPPTPQSRSNSQPVAAGTL